VDFTEGWTTTDAEIFSPGHHCIHGHPDDPDGLHRGDTGAQSHGAGSNGDAGFAA